MKFIYFIIILSAINKPIAYALNHYFGVGRIAFAAFSFIFLILLFRPNIKLFRANSIVYIFLLFMFVKGLIDFIYVGFSQESFFLAFSTFRRVGLPFAVFIYFVEKLRNPIIFDKLNRFLRNWFLFIIVYQIADFVLMNTIAEYRHIVNAIWNSFEVMQEGTSLLTSHLPFLHNFYRCFGIYIDFHASGLYVLMLYVYNIKMNRSFMPFWVHILAAIAIFANGSLVFLSLYLILLLLSVNLIYRNKLLFLVLFITSALLFINSLADYYFPVIGKAYLFKLLDIWMTSFVAYYINQGHIGELLWGVGGVFAIGKSWTFGNNIGFEDIGFVRLILEMGLVMLIGFFVVLLSMYFKYVAPYKSKEPLAVSASVFAILLGLISLVHTPILFSINNIVLFMIFLAIIATQNKRASI